MLAGFFTFFAIEKIVRRHSGGDGHGHSHSRAHAHTTVSSGKSKDDDKTQPGLRRRKGGNDDGNGDKGNDKDSSALTSAEDFQASEHARVTGWLNLAADWSHNVTDGFSIAATYLVSRQLGFTTTLAVFFHEIPHEIGDFAILIQSGFTRRQALLAQLSTAMGAVMGTAFGLFLDYAGIESVSSYLLPFTAGGFIYVASVGVIPELLQDCSPRQTIKEILAMALGVGMMVIVALYE